MYSEDLELPGGDKVRVDYDLTDDGRWCAVLKFAGMTVRGLGKDRRAAKAELVRKLGEALKRAGS